MYINILYNNIIYEERGRRRPGPGFAVVVGFNQLLLYYSVVILNADPHSPFVCA